MELWQLPQGIYELVLYGWATGRDTLEPEVRRLNHESDRLYRAAFGERVSEPINYMTFEKLEQLRDSMYSGAVNV